jgi:hypothetical protein
MEDVTSPFRMPPESEKVVRKSRFSEEQTIAMLKESEVRVKTEELCRRHGITRAG